MRTQPSSFWCSGALVLWCQSTRPSVSTALTLFTIWYRNISVEGNNSRKIKLSFEKKIIFVCTTVSFFTVIPDTEKNLALDQMAWSSSIYSGWEARRAVDGNYDNMDAGNALAMTNSDMKAWLAVDLDRSYRATTVNVCHRSDNRK